MSPAGRRRVAGRTGVGGEVVVLLCETKPASFGAVLPRRKVLGAAKAVVSREKGLTERKFCNIS